MRVLILGGTGFCGFHLAQLYLEEGAEVFIAGRKPRPNMAPNSQFLPVDTTKPESIIKALEASTPDHIYHLAGLASVARSFGGKEEVYQVNVMGTFHVLESIRKLCPDARVLVVGSAEEYGPVAVENLPIHEEMPLHPLSPYGVSRVASTLMSLRESRRHQKDGLQLVATRTFNLTGPGQSETYVCSDFARQVAVAKLAGKTELTMTTGNLEVKRDFSSVKDGVKAYRLLIEKGEVGRVYNVCSGESIKISRIVEILGELSGLRLTTQIDPKRLRKSEVQEVRGDPSALLKATGFRPREKGLRESLEELFQEWFAKLSKESGK